MACFCTYTVRICTGYRSGDLRISPCGSGSDFYITNPDPRIRILVSGSASLLRSEYHILKQESISVVGIFTGRLSTGKSFFIIQYKNRYWNSRFIFSLFYFQKTTKTKINLIKGRDISEFCPQFFPAADSETAFYVKMSVQYTLYSSTCSIL